MKIAVWSKNPVKINAVALSAEKCTYFWWEKIEVVWENVSSDISDMPISMDEILLWAKNRAHNLAKVIDDAEYYIWIEWGTTIIWEKAYLFWVTHILNSLWEEHIWFTQFMEVPEYFRRGIYEEGKELWPMEDELNKIENVWQKNGSFWMWTDDMLSRQLSFEISFICAISPFYNKNYKLS